MEIESSGRFRLDGDRDLNNLRYWSLDLGTDTDLDTDLDTDP